MQNHIKLIFKLIITFIIVFLLNIIKVKSQNITFSQFKPNLIYYNPAFAGYVKCSTMSLAYRNQWVGINTGFNTFNAGYNQYVNFLHGGIGLNIIKDVAGKNIFNKTSVNSMYSFHVNIFRKFTGAFALNLSYLQYDFNNQGLIYSDMIDNLYGVTNSTNEIPIYRNMKNINFSTGFLLYNKKYFFGIAIKHIHQFNITDSKINIPIKYGLQAGARFSFDKLDLRKEQFAISPIIIYNQQQNEQNLLFGFYFIKNFYTFGVLFRESFFPYFTNESVILHLGIKINKLAINYSYDISTTKLWKKSYGAHEISIIFRFNCKENMKNNTIICPAYEL